MTAARVSGIETFDVVEGPEIQDLPEVPDSMCQLLQLHLGLHLVLESRAGVTAPVRVRHADCHEVRGLGAVIASEQPVRKP